MSWQFQTSAKTESKQSSTSVPSRLVQNLGNRTPSHPSEPAEAPLVQHEALNLPIHAAHPVIQPKLTIGPVSDPYEQEADRIAAQVVSQINTPQASQQGTPLQHQETPAEDGKLQMKSALPSPSATPATPELEADIQRSRSGGQSLPENICTSMEQAIGADFSGVKVHADEHSNQLSRSIQAEAFTVGQDIFFRQGAYQPQSRSGQQLLAHELTHVVQQNGRGTLLQPPSNPVIQRYKEEKISGDDTRVADDETAAVTQESHIGGQEMFAQESLIKAAQKKLGDVHSNIELQISSATMRLPQTDGSVKTLKRVWPRNQQNKTGGITEPGLTDKIKAKVLGKPAPKLVLEMMQLWADCGRSNGVVLGGSDRRAVFRSQTDRTIEKTSTGSPAQMKVQVLIKMLSEVADQWTAKLNTLATEDPNRAAYLKGIKLIRDEQAWTRAAWIAVGNLSRTASTDEDWDNISNEYDKIADHVLASYNSFPVKSRDIMSKKAGINEYANPDIGQGFTISTGGKNLSRNTWNFHWAGVVLKSADGADSVTLENYAVGDPSVQNDEWVFQMYGHKRKKQSFHAEHQGSRLHGETPTTLVVEKRPTK